MPPISPLKFDDYVNNASQRVREDELDEATQYSLIAELTLSSYGGFGELQTRIDRVVLNELGKASLRLRLLDTDSGDFMINLDAHSQNGFIQPSRIQRLNHNRMGNLGAITQGYLLGPDAVLAPISTDVPEQLPTHASWRGPGDTRTSILELGGILIGRD